MAKNQDPLLKRCRTLGLSPAVIGSTKKPSKRHQADKKKRKLSGYGLQLREKQKAKFVYGLLESQFSNLYHKAAQMRGVTGENLLQMLEQRLDNTVFRLGFAKTRPAARQFVNHCHVSVNGKTVNIPSFLVQPGDIIEIREKARSTILVKRLKETPARFLVPKWLKLDENDTFKGTVLHLPQRSDIDFEINESLIVELYSK